ncbi:MAG: helix-turn-helix transcriptional regulator [Bdellovibrionaceae bacterium]|nr:helix-turn-helix transcriptional regulator [Pseudobdellovibrionaceae bacterium]
MKYTDVKDHLKRALRDQGVTYTELGRQLRMSESGVKKLFAAPDISLDRLGQICEILGLSVHELLDPKTSLSETQTITLTEKAQEFFMKNRACFLFLILLYTEPLGFEELIARHKIGRQRAYGYLRELERLKLLRWLPGDRVDLRKDVPALFRYEGRFMKQIVREWSEELLGEALENPQGEMDFFTSRILHLTPESTREFKRAFDDLVSEFARRSVREKKLQRQRVLPTRSLVVLREGHFVGKV